VEESGNGEIAADAPLIVSRDSIQDYGGTDSKASFTAAGKYYLTENHRRTLCNELGSQFFLLFVCASGASLYVEPAKAYAKRINEEDRAWMYIVGTCLPSLVVLYVATDTFFKMHASTVVPKALKAQLRNPQTVAHRIGENALIATLSLLSSVPLAVVSYQYHPEHWSDRLLWAMVAVILLDNTVLHFLPVKLVLNQPAYRWPIYPFELLIKKISGFKVASGLRNIEVQQQLSANLHRAQRKAEHQTFIWNGWGYDVKVPEIIRGFSNDSDPIKKILSILDQSDRGETLNRKIPACLNTGLRTMLSLLGALWVWFCCVGYYATTLNQFHNMTDNYVKTALITAVPIYILSVLMVFFGISFLSGLYDYFTIWGQHVTKIPAEIKLYPKAFLASMLVNISCLPFCYAASVELIYSGVTYDWALPAQPFLVGCAMSGSIFVSFCAVRDFFMLMSKKHATYFGSEERYLFCEVDERINALRNSLLCMDYDGFQRDENLQLPVTAKQGIGLFTDQSDNRREDPKRDLRENVL
jgi:hypothetical protein